MREKAKYMVQPHAVATREHSERYKVATAALMRCGPWQRRRRRERHRRRRIGEACACVRGRRAEIRKRESTRVGTCVCPRGSGATRLCARHGSRKRG